METPVRLRSDETADAEMSAMGRMGKIQKY